MFSAGWNACGAVERLGRCGGDAQGVKALEQSFNEILRRHEAWRTAFKVVDGEPIQEVQENLAMHNLQIARFYYDVKFSTGKGGLKGAQSRLITSCVNGINIVNVYIPNGQAVGSEKFGFKLAWMQRLREFFDANYDPKTPVLLCGDFNVAPEDRDVHDVRLWQGRIMFKPHVHDAETEAMLEREIEALLSRSQTR